MCGGGRYIQGNTKIQPSVLKAYSTHEDMKKSYLALGICGTFREL